MKVALIADTHFGVRNDSPIFHNYFGKSFDWFFKTIDEQNIKHIIHLGDLFDRRKYLNFLTAKVCREQFLEQVEKRKIETHVILGNHDVYYKDTHDVNALDEIVEGRYKHIKVYSVPSLINLNGLDIQLLPWICESNSEASREAIKTTKAEIVIGHLELNGFEMFNGIVSDHGENKDIYKRFDLVFTGHYHHRSVNGNIHYIGAFGEYTWADYNDPRGFTILDTETREFEFHRNPYAIFKMIAYDDVKHTDIVDKINATNYDKYKDCYVKVVCINRTNPYAFDLMFDKLYKANPIDISVIEGVNNFIDNDGDGVVDEAEDTPTILSKYIDGLTLPVSNDKMKKFMKEVYTEALSVEHVE